MMSVEDLIRARDNSHGNYKDNSELFMSFVDALQDSPNFRELPSTRRKALILIASKMSRIVAGDHSFSDHWDDIIGYAKLGANDGTEGIVQR